MSLPTCSDQVGPQGSERVRRERIELDESITRDVEVRRSPLSRRGYAKTGPARAGGARNARPIRCNRRGARGGATEAGISLRLGSEPSTRR